METVSNISQAMDIISNAEPTFEPGGIDERIMLFNSLEGKIESDTPINCPVCKNKRQVAYNNDGYLAMRQCECVKQIKSLWDIKKSGLGAVNKHTFENYKADAPWQTNILDTAKDFVRQPLGKWFFIGGQVGSGKTHICKAIAYEFIKQGKFAKYMEWRSYVLKFNTVLNEPECVALRDEYLTAPVLYIDDFLKTGTNNKLSPGDINRAIDIIYGRYTQEDTTLIISSEKTLKQLLAIDEGVASRIQERCSDYLINIGKDQTKNYRKKPPAK